MLSNMRLCSNVPAQAVVQTALGGHQSVNDYIVPGGRIYEQREYIYTALTDIPGISAVKPQAAFYMFPKIDTKKFDIVNDEKFALDLLRDKKLLIVHGGGFNWKEPDHFRVVYLPRIESLKEAVEKIGDFLSYYRQKFLYPVVSFFIEYRFIKCSLPGRTDFLFIREVFHTRLFRMSCQQQVLCIPDHLYFPTEILFLRHFR